MKKVDKKEIEKAIQDFIYDIYTYYENNREIIDYVHMFAYVLKKDFDIHITYL